MAVEKNITLYLELTLIFYLISKILLVNYYSLQYQLLNYI